MRYQGERHSVGALVRGTAFRCGDGAPQVRATGAPAFFRKAIRVQDVDHWTSNFGGGAFRVRPDYHVPFPPVAEIMLPPGQRVHSHHHHHSCRYECFLERMTDRGEAWYHIELFH